MDPGSGIPAGAIGCLTARAIAGNRLAATMKLEPNQIRTQRLMVHIARQSADNLARRTSPFPGVDVFRFGGPLIAEHVSLQT